MHIYKAESKQVLLTKQKFVDEKLEDPKEEEYHEKPCDKTCVSTPAGTDNVDPLFCGDDNDSTG
jgi:hypothetical protein